MAVAVRKEDVPDALKAIEEVISDLKQIHFALSVTNDPPDYETCDDTDCPSHPSNELGNTMSQQKNEELEAELLRALLAITYGGKPQKTCFQLADCSIRFMTEEEVDAEAPPENN